MSTTTTTLRVVRSCRLSATTTTATSLTTTAMARRPGRIRPCPRLSARTWHSSSLQQQQQQQQQPYLQWQPSSQRPAWQDCRRRSFVTWNRSEAAQDGATAAAATARGGGATLHSAGKLHPYHRVQAPLRGGGGGGGGKPPGADGSTSAIHRGALGSRQSRSFTSMPYATTAAAAAASADPLLSYFYNYKYKNNYRQECWDGSIPCNKDIFPEESLQQVLACSSNNSNNTTIHDLALQQQDAETEVMTVLGRVVHWFQRACHSGWGTIVLLVRGSEVVLRLSPLLVLTPVSVFTHHVLHCYHSYFYNDTEKHPSHSHHYESNLISDLTWRYTTYQVQSLGPAFVKLCQWIATRRDIFPPNICDRLASLHDRAWPHSWTYTEQELIRAFGADYKEKGLEILDTKTVVGCGSAAQVYRGTLTTQRIDPQTNQQVTVRRPVAVKVLHPRFEKMVSRDLWCLQTAAAWLHALPLDTIRMLNFPRACQNFGSVLERQADLRLEAANLIQFRRNFYGTHDKDDEQQQRRQELESAIVFPRPMEGWISQNVLVEDLVTAATPIAEFLRQEEGADLEDVNNYDEIRKELAGPLLRAFLKMVFLDNFVHCDLHPGNVLVQTRKIVVPEEVPTWLDRLTGKVKALSDNGSVIAPTATTTIIKRSIVFLDAGIATSLSVQDQCNLRDLFRAVLLNRGDEAGRLMVERAKYERCSQVPGGVDAFCAGIQDLVSEFHDRRKDGLTLGAVRIGSLLSRVLDLCRIHGVEIDPSMASIVVSTLVLEGLGRSLEPSLNLIDFAVPFVLGRGRV